MNAPNRTIVVRGLRLLAVLGALAVAAAPAHADLKDGRNALQAGRLDEALRHFEQSASAGLAEGRAGVGQVHLKRGQLDQAMEAFVAAERMDGNLALAHWGQGEVMRRQEKCDQALPKLKRATELDRRFPEAELSYSACLAQLKRFDEAVTSANRGLNWGTQWRPRFLIALGDSETARDSIRQARTWYTMAAQEAPNDPQTRRALGEYYVKRGTFELAYPELQAAADMDSSDLELRFALAQAFYYGKRYSEALQEYQRVVARDPNFPPGQLALGNLLYLSGKADPRRFGDRFAEARVPLEAYVKMAPNDARGYSLLGRTLYFQSAQDKNEETRKAALDAMNRAEQLGDKSREMYTIRARLHADMRQFDQALADYALGEPEPEDMLRLAQLYEIGNRASAADSMYDQMIRADSTSGSARIALSQKGKMRYREALRQGVEPGEKRLRLEEAMGLFERRIALDPTNDEAYYYIGLSRKELGQYAEALTALRQAAALGNDKPERHFWLGIMHQQLGAQDSARVSFERVVTLDPEGKGPNTALALRQLGYFKLLGKEWSGAIPVLEQSSKINAKDAQTWVWLGQAHQNSGSRPKACEAYREALKLSPGQPEASAGVKALGC